MSVAPEAVVGLRIFVKGQAGGFLIVFIETQGVPVLVYGKAVALG